MAKFSKKHYIAVTNTMHKFYAETVADSQCSVTEFEKGYDAGTFQAIKELSRDLAKLFAADNRAFDRERFIKAVTGKE